MDTSSLVIPSASLSFLSAQSIVVSNTLTIGQVIIGQDNIVINQIVANSGIFNYLVANSLTLTSLNLDNITSNIAQFNTLYANLAHISTLTAQFANIDVLQANGISIQQLENLTVLNTLTANIIQSDVLSCQANSVIYSVGNLDISAHQVLRGNANLIVFHANTISIVGNLVQSNGNIVVFEPSDNIQLNSHVIIRGNLSIFSSNILLGDTTLGNLRVLGNLILGANNLPGPRFAMPSPRIISTQGSQAVGLAEFAGGVLDSTSAQTYPTAATLMVRGECIAGANTTITDALALSVTGNSKLTGNLTVTNRLYVQQTPINPLEIANHTPAIALANGASGWTSDAYGNVVGLVNGNAIVSLIDLPASFGGPGIVVPTVYFRRFDNVVTTAVIRLIGTGNGSTLQIRNGSGNGNLSFLCGPGTLGRGAISFEAFTPTTATFMVTMGNIQLRGNFTTLFGHIINLQSNILQITGNTTITANVSVTDTVTSSNVIVSRQVSANVVAAQFNILNPHNAALSDRTPAIAFNNHPYSGFAADALGNVYTLVNANTSVTATDTGLVIERGASGVPTISFRRSDLALTSMIQNQGVGAATSFEFVNSGAGGNILLTCGTAGAITFTGNAALFRVNMGNIRMEGNTTTMLGNVDMLGNLTVYGNLFIHPSMTGDMLYYNAGYQRLANGEANSMLSVNLSGLPIWSSSYVGHWGNVGNVVLVNTANAIISDVGMSLLFRNSGNLVATNMDGNSMVTYTGGQSKVFTVQFSCSASMTGAVAIQVWIMLRKNMIDLLLNASSGLAIGTTSSSYPMTFNTIVSMAPGDNLTAHVFTTSGGAADITLSDISFLLTSINGA